MAEQTILIVDDDPGVLARLTAGFISRGYRVETAANGREALGVLDRVRPTLIFFDLDMPVLDGWGFARELRKRGLQLPLVLLSDDSAARHVAREIGAVGFLTKPSRGRSHDDAGAAAA
jgi:CheY-like chemotaxis protein